MWDREYEMRNRKGQTFYEFVLDNRDYVGRYCDWCNSEYQADTRNLKRGWGKCCSKSCAAKKREADKKSKVKKDKHFSEL